MNTEKVNYVTSMRLRKRHLFLLKCVSTISLLPSFSKCLSMIRNDWLGLNDNVPKWPIPRKYRTSPWYRLVNMSHRFWFISNETDQLQPVEPMHSNVTVPEVFFEINSNDWIVIIPNFSEGLSRRWWKTEVWASLTEDWNLIILLIFSEASSVNRHHWKS